VVGVSPAEARGLRWEDWDRVKQQIKIARSVWHTFEGTKKTPQRERDVAVSKKLREVPAFQAGITFGRTLKIIAHNAVITAREANSSRA
jgi:DNA mismatch repair protein MutH